MAWTLYNIWLFYLSVLLNRSTLPLVPCLSTGSSSGCQWIWQKSVRKKISKKRKTQQMKLHLSTRTLLLSKRLLLSSNRRMNRTTHWEELNVCTSLLFGLVQLLPINLLHRTFCGHKLLGIQIYWTIKWPTREEIRWYCNFQPIWAWKKWSQKVGSPIES